MANSEPLASEGRHRVIGSEDLLRRHIERLLRIPVAGWRSVAGRGWSVSVRGVAELADGRTVFAKLGDVPDTIGPIRDECRAYEVLSGSFIPSLLAADPAVPILVIEDLSAATWPPPWTSALLAALDRTFEELAATVAPPGLPSLEEWLAAAGAWELVAANAAPFLATGLVSPEWLDSCMPTLLTAQSAAPVGGDRLLHLDVRSDNLCFRAGRGVLVDWNHAAVGDPRWDRLLALPSIELEGGPPARSLASNADPGVIAWMAGYFAARVGLPPPQGAPRVRGFQRAQLEVALQWAAERLNLPALGW